jgi:hypothetical protein
METSTSSCTSGDCGGAEGGGGGGVVDGGGGGGLDGPGSDDGALDGCVLEGGVGAEVEAELGAGAAGPEAVAAAGCAA